MIINTTRGNFIVQFFYDTPEGKHPLFHKNKITSCKIKLMEDGVKNEDSTVIGHGSVTCHHKDQFTKEGGRKRALRRAMEYARTKAQYQAFYDESFRREFWASYLSQVKGHINISKHVPRQERREWSREVRMEKLREKDPQEYSRLMRAGAQADMRAEQRSRGLTALD